MNQTGMHNLMATTHEAWPKPLRVGSGVYGWALLDDVPIWYELWRQVNGFPPNYVGGPASSGGKDSKGGKSAAKGEYTTEEDAK